MTGSTVTGQFSSITYTATANFLKPIVVYGTGSATFHFTTVAEFNGDGQASVQDLFDFLSTWFRANSSAVINGGGISIQDMFVFLNLCFHG